MHCSTALPVYNITQDEQILYVAIYLKYFYTISLSLSRTHDTQRRWTLFRASGVISVVRDK